MLHFLHSSGSFLESYFEVDLVNRLQSVIDKQRGQIKKSDQNVLDLKTENEEVTNKKVFTQGASVNFAGLRDLCFLQGLL